MISIISTILSGLQLLIVVDAILSWVMRDTTKFPRNVTTQITDPLYAPIRAILRPERMGGLDVSPLVLLALIKLMQTMLERAAMR
jgi:YggT family protein